MLTLTPISLKDANAYIAENHRHHKRVQGHKWSMAARTPEGIAGVVVVGRPVSRMLDDGMTVEVTRLCTDGTKNACSFLYAAAARAAQTIGYKRIVTYILASEPGTSLIAVGWSRSDIKSVGGTWSRQNRVRIDTHPLEPKVRWERKL